MITADLHPTLIYVVQGMPTKPQVLVLPHFTELNLEEEIPIAEQIKTVYLEVSPLKNPGSSLAPFHIAEPS